MGGPMGGGMGGGMNRNQMGNMRSLLSGGDGPNRMWNNGDRRMGGDRMGTGGVHCVHMRGLPFRASEGDIADVSCL